MKLKIFFVFKQATGFSIIASVVPYCVLVAALVQGGQSTPLLGACGTFGCANIMASISAGLLGIRALLIAIGADCFVCNKYFINEQNLPQHQLHAKHRILCWDVQL